MCAEVEVPIISSCVGSGIWAQPTATGSSHSRISRVQEGVSGINQGIEPLSMWWGPLLFTLKKRGGTFKQSSSFGQS